MSRRSLICFTGADGSGKTTVSQFVARSLSEDGMKTTYVYGRYKPFVGAALRRVGKLVFMRGRAKSSDYSAYTRDKRDALNRRGIVRSLYAATLVGEYVVQLWMKVGLRLLAGRTVVCDRYMFDTVVTDLAADLRFTSEDVSRWARRLARLVPRPTLVVFIDVPPEVAITRKSDIPNLGYLQELRDHYLRVTREVGAVVVSGVDDLETVKSACLARARRHVADKERSAGIPS